MTPFEVHFWDLEVAFWSHLMDFVFLFCAITETAESDCMEDKDIASICSTLDPVKARYCGLTSHVHSQNRSSRYRIYKKTFK